MRNWVPDKEYVSFVNSLSSNYTYYDINHQLGSFPGTEMLEHFWSPFVYTSSPMVLTERLLKPRQEARAVNNNI
jgi:hypothetical protein